LTAASADQSVTQPHGSGMESAGGGESDATTPQDEATQNPKSSPSEKAVKQGFYRAWRRMRQRAKEAQPDWLSPLATTSGRIKDEFRYDVWRQSTPAGGRLSTFGGARGLELIVAPRVQLLLGIPPYVSHSAASPPDGFGDLPLMMKLRLASANASDGDYLVTVLLSATAPTVSGPNGAGLAVLTPTMAFGKGWGRFDVQSTLGENLPTGDTQRLGRQFLWNTTFQYRCRWKLWPELEANSTFFQDGKDAGETQTFLTPGLGFGRVRAVGPLRFSMAGGVQIAVTRFHTYDHRWMLSVRFSL
jgi:hypothetical protein